MPWRAQHPDDFPSLGWELLDWWAEFLPSPRDASAPLIFTDEQARQLVEWFRLDPVDGRLVYRRGYSRRAKGWGKSPVEAAKAIAEFRGPVRFAGWDANGQPVGMPWGVRDAPRAWVQVAAISEDQTDNTWSVIHYLLTENDGRAADALRIDAGLTRCFLRDLPGAKLEPVSAAAGSREGQPITYGVIDESHLMLPTNGGVRLARTIRRNVAKMGGRSYETTNAYVIGQDSVAESSHRAVLSGTPGVFADEVEAPVDIGGVKVDLTAPDEVLLAALDVAYGMSWWVDKARLLADIRDPSSPWEDSARFFMNWPTDEDAGGVIPVQVWNGLVDRTQLPVSHEALAIAVSPVNPHAEVKQWASIGLAGRTADGKLMVLATDRLRADDDRRAPGVNWLTTRALELWNERKVPFRIHRSGPEAAFIAEFRELGIEVVEVPSIEVAQATGAFIAAANHDELRHHGQPSLDRALAGAHVREQTDGGVMWWQRGSRVEITPLVAVTIAAGGVPVEVPRPPQVWSWSTVLDARSEET